MESSAVTDFQTYIPEDLLIPILLLLPTKSLVRLRCVCKLWYDIITSNSFNDSRLKTSTPTKYLLFECFRSYSCYEPYSYHLEESSTLESKKDRNYDDSSKLLDTLNKYKVKIYGSCNGLLCLSDFNLTFKSSVFLWNPIIRKAKRIRSAPKSSYNHPGVASLCFGYYEDDYKVIKICLMDKRIYHVAVYSLRSDCWEITTSYSDGTDLMDRYLSTKFVNGAAYFGFVGQIVSFNLLDKSIREIKYPETYNSHKINKMEPYGDSIALMSVGWDCFPMWVLRNCGNASTPSMSRWELDCTKKNSETGGICYPLGFINSDEYMVRAKSGRYYYSYKLESSQLNTLSLDDLSLRLNLFVVVNISPFVENLVLLDEKPIDPFAKRLHLHQIEI